MGIFTGKPDQNLTVKKTMGFRFRFSPTNQSSEKMFMDFSSIFHGIFRRDRGVALSPGRLGGAGNHAAGLCARRGSPVG